MASAATTQKWGAGNHFGPTCKVETGKIVLLKLALLLCFPRIQYFCPDFALQRVADCRVRTTSGNSFASFTSSLKELSRALNDGLARSERVQSVENEAGIANMTQDGFNVKQ